jgi:hypothetical protein
MRLKRFLEILTDVRIASTEIGSTITVLLLIVYGTYKAWQAWQQLIAKLFK